MNSLALKVLAVLLIFIGEALAIYSEMLVAKHNPILSNLFKFVIMISIGGVFLLFGYSIGFKIFKNIWIVSALSITSILIIEPILAYSIFRQLPTRGAIIGFIFGILGFISSFVFD